MSNLAVKLSEISSNFKAKRINNPQKVLIPAFLATGLILKSQPKNDILEISNLQAIKRQNFIDNFINDEKSEEIIKNYDFDKYGKKGIPLSFSRKDFIKEVNNQIKNLSIDSQNYVLNKFNLRKEFDIDGIANIDEVNIGTEEENSIKKSIEKFYNNKVNIPNKDIGNVLTNLIQGMPEFSMTVGKVQHGTHIYSVDIHTLKVLQNCLKNPNYQNLSQDDKLVLKMSVLMHDFGKKGQIVTPGHAAQSKEDAEIILKNYNIKPELKTRILNQIANHHWFEGFNNRKTTAEDVKEIFKTPNDLAIAKIMAKGDLEGISPIFHRQILKRGVLLSQEEYEKIFNEEMSKINF